MSALLSDGVGTAHTEQCADKDAEIGNIKNNALKPLRTDIDPEIVDDIALGIAVIKVVKPAAEQKRPAQLGGDVPASAENKIITYPDRKSYGAIIILENLVFLRVDLMPRLCYNISRE